MPLAAGEWPATEPEPVQSWLSNLPADTPLTTLVRLAKVRWRIEHDYCERKQALGLAHFEGRTWNGWHHHVNLDSGAHAFCTLQRLARSPKLSVYQVVRELQLLLMVWTGASSAAPEGFVLPAAEARLTRDDKRPRSLTWAFVWSG
ncbi:hypothetical protein ACIGXU_03385 [Streptomyces lydicus]|uniref:hypothetical protein n=1 Tax=Streptomyces lydicus TaxID=47763 RepID=UPI0037CE1E6F